MGKRSKRAIYYTTNIMLTGKNKRRKLMVALRIVQKEIFVVKGQLISEENFGVFKSPKKQTNK